MDALRDYLRLAFDYSADGKIHAASVAWSNMTDDDRSLVLALVNRIDDHATKNAGLLADLTDAIYGKGTAETRGYPRGMVAKVKRVFGRLRRVKRDERGDDELDCFYGWQDLRPLLKEVK